MATKYYYEVYEKIGEKKEIPHAQEYKAYEEARAKVDHLDMLVHPEPRPRRDYGIDKWRTIEDAEPERLGECVDGDLEAPFNCDVCGEELFEGDRTYMTTGGTVIDDYIDNSGEEFYTTACTPCGQIISDAVSIAQATIVKQRGGGE